MISKQEFLDYIEANLDPDELVDLFGCSTTDMTRIMHALLWSRRFKVAHLFEDLHISDELCIVEDAEYDEELSSLDATRDFSDSWFDDPNNLDAFLDIRLDDLD